MPEEYEGDQPENLDIPPSFFPSDSTLEGHGGVDYGDLIQVRVDGIFAHEGTGKISYYVVVSDGERKLPIAIGAFEANAINLIIENARPDRPMTHDLIKNVIERLDYSLDRAAIDDYWNGVYYAKLYLRKGDSEEIEIDSRPSDAIALAVRFGAPIYVADGILDIAVED